MLCSYDDLCYIISTVLRGRYCVIQRSCCNTNNTIIIAIRIRHRNRMSVDGVDHLLLVETAVTVHAIIIPVLSEWNSFY